MDGICVDNEFAFCLACLIFGIPRSLSENEKSTAEKPFWSGFMQIIVK